MSITSTTRDFTGYRAEDRDLNLINTLRQLFLVARDQKRARYDNWLRNYRIVNNRISGTQAAWMPMPRDSEVYPVLSSLVAWMTDQEPAVGFVPASDPNSNYYQYIQSIASDLDNVFSSNWISEEYDRQVKLFLWDALLYGLGAVKNVWDNGAGGGQGNAVLRRVDPWALYIDPMATCFADAEYFVEARRMSYDQLERMYPKSKALLGRSTSSTDGLDDRPSLFYESNQTPKAPFLGPLPSGNAMYNKSTSGSRQYDPLPGYVVYEYWLKENDEPNSDSTEGLEYNAKPRWRCVVLCNNYILFDEWADDLWLHGQHPYEDYRFDDIGEMYGISLVDHLAQPQIYINRLLTALQQNAELVGNPIFLEPTNSGLSRVGIINRPGQRLPVSSAAAAGSNLPRWLEPPSMPSSVMDLVNFWINRIENTSGLNALQKGKAPNQRSAENTINSVQEAAFVRIRSALTNLQWTYQRCALKLSDLIIQNYTEPRYMAILGPEGNQTALYLKDRHFYDPNDNRDTPLSFAIRVEAGANAATSRQARVANAERLFGLGAVDDQYVLEVGGVKDAQKILARLYAKRQAHIIGPQGGARQRTAPK